MSSLNLTTWQSPQPSAAWVQRALADEVSTNALLFFVTYTDALLQNVQYLILAFFWFTSKPIARKLTPNFGVTFDQCSLLYTSVSLLPYTIFSLFHALTFTRTTVMPQILQPGPPATAGGAPTPHPLSKKLQVWVRCKSADLCSRIVLLPCSSQLRPRHEDSGFHGDHHPRSRHCRRFHVAQLVPHTDHLRAFRPHAVLPVGVHQRGHHHRHRQD